MQLAIDKTREGIQNGQSPFGCAIVKGDDVVAVTHNTVWLTCDPTAHAEVNCIRAAAKKLNTIDLSGCTMYTTCEPCPMCLTATHWAKIDTCYFGATIADAEARLLGADDRGGGHGRAGQEPAQSEGRHEVERMRGPFPRMERSQEGKVY